MAHGAAAHLFRPLFRLSLTQTLTLPTISSGESLAAPTVANSGQFIVLPTGFTSTTLNAPTVTTGSVTVTLPTITSTTALTVPTVKTGIILPFLSTLSGFFAFNIAPGAVTVTLPTIASSATVNAPAAGDDFPYPVAVSGRRLVDQNGNGYLVRNMALWAAAQNGTDADITTVLEDLAGKGFGSVMVAPCGLNYNAYGGTGWTRYQNRAGANFFTGTQLASSLGSAWTSMDLVMSEATRLGMTVIITLYTGWDNVQGLGNDLVTAGTTNAYNYGVAVATRYASYQNIVWHYGADYNFNYGTAPSQVVDAWFHGIRDTEGSTHRLVLAEPYSPNTSYTQFISQEGTSGTGYQWLQIDVNSVYTYDYTTVEQFDTVYTQTGATTLPVWDCEIPYRGATWTGAVPPAPPKQELRERCYSTFIRGGIGLNYGDADMWSMGRTGLDMGGGTTHIDALDLAETFEAGYAYQFVNTWCNDSTWTPDAGTFLTTGLGSGSTKAAAGYSTTVALAYFPTSRTVAVNTTVIGSTKVRLRWWDPTAASYTTIAATETATAGRSVTYPASAHTDTFADWVLVVDEVIQTIALATIATSTTLNVPTVTPGAVTVTLPTITTGQVLRAPTITVGSVTVTLPTITTSTALSTPTVVPSASNVTLPTIGTVVVLRAPTVAIISFPQTVTLPTITSTETLTTPTVIASGALAAPSITSTTVLRAPTVTTGAVTITGANTASTTVLYTPTVTAVSAVTLPTITTSTTLYGATILAGGAIATATITSTNVLRAPTVTVGSTTLLLTHIPAAGTMHAPRVGEGAFVGSAASRLAGPAATSSVVGPAATSTIRPVED